MPDSSMQITKYNHACVAAAKDGATLVIDPGIFTTEDVLSTADAVLITHEHFDHFIEDKIRAGLAANPRLQVYTNQSVGDLLTGLGSALHIVGAGDCFTAAGFEVQVYGEWHAVIHPDIPQIKNIGFLVDATMFHPGDAFTVPDVAVETLLLPAHAPWSKLSEIIDYVRAVAPVHSVAVHDGLLNDNGFGVLANLLGGPLTGPSTYERFVPPAQFEL
jgi:L-ascorbate metabolism protein UlaG (beta-lactamase superfamily)